jgi:hypothetical protein
MKIKLFQYVLILSLSGCISSFNLDHNTNQYLLVVDGKITQKDTRHELILRRSTATGSAHYNPVANASVRLYDEEGNYEDYFPADKGKYILEGNVLDRIPGRSYYIEIILPNERTYRSVLQKMPEVIKPDKLYFELEEIEELNNLENTIMRNYLNLYINTPIFKNEKDVHFIWRVDHVYSFTELFCHPLKPVDVCYISRKLQSDDIKLFTSEELSGGKLEHFRVGSIDILPSWEFFEKHFFNVAQHSITREAYDYWNTVKLVAQSTGSIFDTPPSPIQGNIYNINDPDDRVLGFFEVSAVDTIRTYTNAEDLEPLYIEDRCDPYNWRTRGNPGCCNCLEIPDSQLERPEYWGFIREEE